MYAIVDIETTGVGIRWHRIIEIGIVFHDGKKITGSFETLINPGRKIPPFITAITGITNEMVSSAPSFPDVAAQVQQLIGDKIFVAHNVNFDYGFIKKEMRDCGISFNQKRLCTVRLARRVFPGRNSYSLGNLCASLNIPLTNAHRAMADANAASELFSMILKNDQQNIVSLSLKRNSREYILPPHLDKQKLEDLPSKTGVYKFLDNKGKVIYVGKAKDLKKRVSSHFSLGSDSRRKSFFSDRIHDVQYELTGNELIALVLEASLIRKLWPRFNEQLKTPGLLYGIFQYQDQNGLYRLAISKSGKWAKPIITFRTSFAARERVSAMTSFHALCPQMNSLHDACISHDIYNCTGVCRGEEDIVSYNNRFKKAIEGSKSRVTGIIKGKGRVKNETSYLFLLHGEPLGFAFLPSDDFLHLNDGSSFQKTPVKCDPEIRSAIEQRVTSMSDDEFMALDPEHWVFEALQEEKYQQGLFSNMALQSSL